MLTIFPIFFFLLKHCPFISVAGWEGTSLLSGGRESVLVEWRDAAEKNKEFLPRLGATIEHISVSPAGDLFCTSHSDNSESDLLLGGNTICVMPQLFSICKKWKIQDLKLKVASDLISIFSFIPSLSIAPFCPKMPPEYSIFRILCKCRARYIWVLLCLLCFRTFSCGKMWRSKGRVLK